VDYEKWTRSDFLYIRGTEGAGVVFHPIREGCHVMRGYSEQGTPQGGHIWRPQEAAEGITAHKWLEQSKWNGKHGN
jgi:hypothetical protein